jgi:hypothetical protein
MTMQNCPALTAVVVQQRHQDLRTEVQREHAARIAAAATTASKNTASTGGRWTPLKALAACLHASSAHRLSGAVRRLELRLSAWRTTPSGA